MAILKQQLRVIKQVNKVKPQPKLRNKKLSMKKKKKPMMQLMLAIQPMETPLIVRIPQVKQLEMALMLQKVATPLAPILQRNVMMAHTVLEVLMNGMPGDIMVMTIIIGIKELIIENQGKLSMKLLALVRLKV